MTDNEIGAKGSNAVGPVLRPGEIADAAIEALEMDNPGKEFTVLDNCGYLRVETQSSCEITCETMERLLGRSFDMQELSVALASFAGQIESDSSRVRFYLEDKR